MIHLASNRPSVSKLENGKISFRPSELGKCTRALAASFLGHEPEPFDEDLQTMMSEGNIHEPHIAYKIEQEFGGKVQRQIRLSLPIEGWGSLDGTCDGVWFLDSSDIDESRFILHQIGPWFDPYIIEYTKKWMPNETKPVIFGVEIKASDEAMFTVMSKDGPIYEYKWQISAYWFMIEHTLGVTPEGFIFAVKNRRNGRITHKWITKPYFTKEEIITRCRDIIRAASMGLDKPESIECDRIRHDCKYWAIHKEEMGLKEKDASKIKGARFVPQILDACLEIYDNEEQMAYLKAQNDILRDQLDQARHHDKKIATPGFRISQENRAWVNETKLLMDHPELLAQYQKFDLEKCLADHPQLEVKYSTPGRPYMVMRKVKAELAKVLSARKKKEAPAKTQKVGYRELGATDGAGDMLARMLEVE